MQVQQASSPDLAIPYVLDKLFAFIRAGRTYHNIPLNLLTLKHDIVEGMHQVGLFRIGPSVVHLQEIRDKIDDTMDVCLSDFHDCVIPTSLIKLYLYYMCCCDAI